MIWRFFLTIKNIKVLTPLTTPNPTPHPNPLLSYLVECDNFTPNLSSSLSKMFLTTYPGLVVGRSEGVGGKEKGGGSRGGGERIYTKTDLFTRMFTLAKVQEIT